MGSGYAGLMGAAGAGSGLETLLAQRFRQQQFEAEQRHMQAQEAFQQQQLNETMQLRLAEQAGKKEDFAQREKDRGVQLNIAQMNADTSRRSQQDRLDMQGATNDFRSAGLDARAQAAQQRKEFQDGILAIRDRLATNAELKQDPEHLATIALLTKIANQQGAQAAEPDLLTRTKRFFMGGAAVPPPTNPNPLGPATGAPGTSPTAGTHLYFDAKGNLQQAP